MTQRLEGRQPNFGRARSSRRRGRRRLVIPRLLGFLGLAAFLAAGLALRLTRGPYADGPRMLGFRPSAAQPEPACVESKSIPPGTTLAHFLSGEGIEPGVANEVLPRLGALLDLRRLGPTDQVRLLSDRSGDFRRLEVHPSAPGEAGSVYVVSRDSTGYQAWRESEPLCRVFRKYQGGASGSLAGAMAGAGILPAQIRQFCAIFGEALDVSAGRPGDTWVMLTEEFVDSEGHLARPGRVVGGRYVASGRVHEAFYFDPSAEGAAEAEPVAALDVAPDLDSTEAAGNGGRLGSWLGNLLARDPILPHEDEPADLEAAAESNVADDPSPLPAPDAVGGVAPLDRDGGYYRADGAALDQGFLRAPLNYRRISSRFTLRRRHPIFHVVRPHLGVDFAAAYGTPVKAVADGVVISAGFSRGYGRLVRVRHRDNIITYSAHLSAFGRGVAAGTRVRQGQVIGYVGTSGHSTGPHLDFRVERNGQFVDPLKFRPSGGEPLAVEDRAEFSRQVRAYREALASLEPGESMPAERFAVLLSANATPSGADSGALGGGTR